MTKDSYSERKYMISILGVLHKDVNIFDAFDKYFRRKQIANEVF
jgi:hypothetical protein